MPEEHPTIELCPAGVAVEIIAVPFINFAMQQNDVPILLAARICNNGDLTFPELILRVTTEPTVTAVAERSLSSLMPGDEIIIKDLHPRLLRKELAQQTERELGELRVELLQNGVPIFRLIQRMTVLAANEWSGARVLPELLAAFILPNQPAVEQVLAKARDLLLEKTGDATIKGYQNQDDVTRILAEIAAIYGAIATSGITYSNPPASFENNGQKIRLPDQMFENRLGTCLDLAVLYAGCMELAGLHPLVVLIHGHAFVAVWLRDTTFKQPLTKDAAALLKRIDLGEMVAVEATCMAKTPPAPFQIAQALGRTRLADCKDEEFHYALDVAMAREGGIKPLAFRGGRVVLDEAPEVQMPAVPVNLTDVVAPIIPSLVPPSAPPKDSGPQRLERWKQRLLDLTRRNRLLNFKDTKKSLLLLCPDAADLEDALSVGTAFTILPGPKVMGDEDPRSAVIKIEINGEDALGKFLHGQLAKQILHAAVPEKELDSRLLGITRTARSNLEETGANTLYLALGFLRWYEKDDSHKNAAPILLIPLRIERHSVREGFKISLLDDEPRINVTLLQKLAVDFGLDMSDLDPLPTDETGLDVDGIFARFRNAVKDMPHWDVTEEASICILTFTKFLMWWDLEKNAKALAATPVAKHLIETPTAQYPVPSTSTVPPLEQLDSAIHPSDLFCPLDADSSQISAVVGAAAGHSFVLEGPPGTGKSQTITNLIVHCLAQEKRVLFVSEKAAALNVVYKRLETSGMAPFCLQLHSTKTTREELRRQLAAALNVAGRQSTCDWMQQTQELGELRALLNDYVEALHSQRNIGRSIHWATDLLIHHRDATVIKLPMDMGGLNPLRFKNMCEVVAELKTSAMAIGDPALHSLREFDSITWGTMLSSNLRMALDELRAQVSVLEQAASPVLDSYSLGNRGWTKETLNFAIALTTILNQVPALPATLLREPDWRAAVLTLRQWVAEGRARDDAQAKLLDLYRKDVLLLDVTTLLAATRQGTDVILLNRLLENHVQPAGLANFLAQCNCLIAPTASVTKAVGGILTEYRLGRTNDDFITLQFAATLSRLLLCVPEVSAELLDHGRWQANSIELRNWLTTGKARDEKRGQLLAGYQKDVFSLNTVPLLAAGRQVPDSVILAKLLANQASPAHAANFLAQCERLVVITDVLAKTDPGISPDGHPGSVSWNFFTLQFVATLSRLLLTVPEISAELLSHENWQANLVELRDWLAKGKARDEKRQLVLADYEPDVFAVDLAKLVPSLKQHSSSWFVKRCFIERRAQKALGGLRKQPIGKNDWESVYNELVVALEVQNETRSLETATAPLRFFGIKNWKKGHADWNQLAAILDWCNSFHKHLQVVAGADNFAELCRHWTQLALDARGGTHEGRSAFCKSVDELTGLRKQIAASLGMREGQLWGEDDADGYLKRSYRDLQRWIDWLPAMQVWQLNCRIDARRLDTVMQFMADLEQIGDVQKKTAELLALDTSRFFGPGVNKGEADWHNLEAILDWCNDFHKHLQVVAGADNFPALCRHWTQLALDARGETHEDRAVFCKEFDKLATLQKQLAATIEISGEQLWGADDAAGYLERSSMALQRWVGWLPAMQAWQANRLEKAMDCNTLEKFIQELELIGRVQIETRKLAEASLPNRLFESAWNGGHARWDDLEQWIEWLHQFRTLIQKDNDPRKHEVWMRLALAGKNADAQRRNRFVTAYQAFGDARRDLAIVACVDASDFMEPQGIDSADFLSDCTTTLERWRNGLPGLQAWCQYQTACRQAVSLGLTPIIERLQSGTVQPVTLETVFYASFASGWLTWALSQEPRLSQFLGEKHHDRIEKFRQIDMAIRDITREVVVARLAARIPQVTETTERAKSSELGRISRFVRSNGRASIRSIFSDCPAALSRLKPCLLMSPLSVAQFLGNAFPPFDLVVFDEASQMPAWDAIGAIARGQQLIVVGDTKQLPPTNFFEKKEDADNTGAELDDNIVDDVESILDECKSIFPLKMLNWHYRSRHESLISFSNRRYYDNSLLTFPAPDLDTRKLGVSWREITNGCYDAGKTRTNRIEAEAVVAETVRRLKNPQLRQQSIGIVTFSIAQQGLVEDLLEKARKDNPDLDVFFDQEQTEETVFVKNLETVQGDERDVILFSICYGPDANGRILMNFGPLTNTGGERRLNVAVTRARRQLIVFSTLRPEQIDLSRTKALGVSHLREFLEFAKRSSLAGVGDDSAPGVTIGNVQTSTALEREVVAALTKNGWKVARQVGCSGYRIDLAVQEAQGTGKFLLGIEFDGANYQSAKTARDRDRLRAAVLTSLGWRLHRIWSTDWWQNPTGELGRLETALKNAQSMAPEPLVAAAPEPLQAIVGNEPEDIDVRKAPAPRGYGYGVRVLFDVPVAEIAKTMHDLLDEHVSLAREELYKETSLRFGCQRLTNRVKERLEYVLEILLRDGQCIEQDSIVKNSK